jgi:hypothetical protein
MIEVGMVFVFQWNDQVGADKVNIGLLVLLGTPARSANDRTIYSAAVENEFRVVGRKVGLDLAVVEDLLQVS